jgi:osmotically-inducible protein OsmY
MFAFGIGDGDRAGPRRLDMFPKRSDKELERDVGHELRWDSRLGEMTIDVRVRDGVATLTGIVTSYAEKVAAQEAAHRVTGVLDVAHDIDVKPANGFTRRDTEIAAAVRSALEWDALVPNERIMSTVSEGRVTLEGAVNYWREREDAERAILRLSGVVGVINKITIQKHKVDPIELREEIECALERRAEREAARIRVDINDGNVELWGRVQSWQEKRAVLGSISHAPGVSRVVDHLRIDPYF